MANGVLRSQAEYYGDDVKYTGNVGSETNMYVIEDVYDLCASTIQSSHYELVNDVDFNDHDTYKYGVNTTIFGVPNRYACFLYGNNHKIRNLIIKDAATSIFGIHSASDIIFENLIVINSTSARLFSCFYTDSEVKNIKIGGYLFNSASGCILTGDAVLFTDCSFNLKGLTTDGIYMWGSQSTNKYNRCHINCDISTSSNICMNLKFSRLQDTYITGKIKQIGTSFTNSDKTNNYIEAGTFLNSYVAVESVCETSEFGGYVISSTTSAESVSFMDKSLVPEITERSINNFYYLTTEQATDPDYLLSINFPVVTV